MPGAGTHSSGSGFRIRADVVRSAARARTAGSSSRTMSVRRADGAPRCAGRSRPGGSPQGGLVAERVERDARDDAADAAGSLSDDLDQLPVDRVESASGTASRGRRGGVRPPARAVGRTPGRRPGPGRLRRSGRGRRAQLAEPPLERLDRHPQPRGPGRRCALASFRSRPTRVADAGPGSGSPGPTRRPAASPRSNRGRTAPRPGRGRTPAGRPPARPAPRNASAPSFRRKSQGSRLAGRVSTRTSSSCPRKSSSARSAAVWPAASPSKTSTTRSASRLKRPDMVLAQGRPQGADDVAETHLVRGDHVGVTLDHGHPAGLAAGGTGEIGRVEDSCVSGTAPSRGC